MRTGRVITSLIAVVVATGFALQSPAPTAQLKSEQKADASFQQGIARIDGGWILSGTGVIARVNEKLKVTKDFPAPIPRTFMRKGYRHVGDIDVVGKYIYAPLEQPNYELGDQVTARYDVKTLRFIDAVVLKQHENSFVTVDPKTMIAYSFDRFGGQALLRYDVRANFKPLDPLPMSAFVDKVQGGDVSGGFAWLSTSNPTNELYRVDLETGEVIDLGSAGHVPGEGEGIDATKLRSGRIHTLTVDPTRNPVWLGHFAIAG